MRAMSEGAKYMSRVSEPAVACVDASTGQLRYPDVSQWYALPHSCQSGGTRTARLCSSAGAAGMPAGSSRVTF